MEGTMKSVDDVRRVFRPTITLIACTSAVFLASSAAEGRLEFPNVTIGSQDITKWAWGFLWSAAVWLVGRWFERMKTRTRAALESCGRLRVLHGEWLDALLDAFAPESGRNATLDKLVRFMGAHKFEPRLQNEQGPLSKEPDCSRLLAQAHLFHAEALNAKAKLLGLLDKSNAEYEQARAAVVEDLRRAYDAFSIELERTERLLNKKTDRLIPFIGGRLAENP